MNKYKISIIMPIFNQEKYLENSIKSVINQTMDFKEIELILVDDKSTDKSKEIIEKYSNKYENIIPIFLNQNTGCAGKPKNIGIKKATTPFLMFLDPDDELLDDTCEILYDKIIEEKSDIVSGNAIRIVENIPYIDINFSNDNRKTIIPDKNQKNYKNFRIWGTLFNK